MTQLCPSLISSLVAVTRIRDGGHRTEDGYCSARPRYKLGGWPNVLTICLESLTKSRHRGIAVIFSGLDADGAAALKSFKESGGIAIVQDAVSAKGPQMPTAALKTGAVDFVLAPEEIAAQLEAIANELRDRVVRI